MEQIKEQTQTLENHTSIQEFEDYLDNVAKNMSPEDFREKLSK
jgi:hypothetical protein